MNEASPGPVSIAALRDAVLRGREPPPAQAVARLRSYWWIVVATVCIGSFMGQVDSSIAQMLLPTLEHAFGARLSTVSWVAVAYLLAMAAFLPIFGRLADMVGRKLLYTAGFLLFVLGSELCGFAPDMPVLIAFRVLQAIGAMLLSSNSVAIIVMTASPERRGRALGIQSAAQAVGLGAGPAIGGLVMDTLGWPWVFWINVPVGLVGAILGWLLIPQTKGLPSDSRFDWQGAVLIVPVLTAVMTALNEAHAWGPTSSALLGCVLAAVILLVAFVRAARGHPAGRPLPVPPRCLDRRQHRRLHVVCGFVRNLLPDAPRLCTGLRRFGARGRAAAVDRAGHARRSRPGRRRALRPSRLPYRDRHRHARVRRRAGRARGRDERRARRPAAGDTRARCFRGGPGAVHLAQQQRDHGVSA